MWTNRNRLKTHERRRDRRRGCARRPDHSGRALSGRRRRRRRRPPFAGTLVRMRASDASGTFRLKMHVTQTASAQNVGRSAPAGRPLWLDLRTGLRVAAGHGSGRVQPRRPGREPCATRSAVRRPAVRPPPMDLPATKTQRNARAYHRPPALIYRPRFRKRIRPVQLVLRLIAAADIRIPDVLMRPPFSAFFVTILSSRQDTGRSVYFTITSLVVPVKSKVLVNRRGTPRIRRHRTSVVYRVSRRNRNNIRPTPVKSLLAILSKLFEIITLVLRNNVYWNVLRRWLWNFGLHYYRTLKRVISNGFSEIVLTLIAPYTSIVI